MRYTWACEGCETIVEVDRKLEECYLPPEENCENCTEQKWRKLLNAGSYRWRFCD